MALFGGTIGHVLAFETSLVKWSVGQHCTLLLISWLKALFIATCIFWVQQVFQWNLPMMFLSTGILSVFGSRSILWAYHKFMRYLDEVPVSKG